MCGTGPAARAVQQRSTVPEPDKELLQTCCWGTFPFPKSGCAGTKCLYFYFKVPPLLLPHFTWCFHPLESLGLLSITHGTGSSSEFSFSFDSSCAEGRSLDQISVYLQIYGYFIPQSSERCGSKDALPGLLTPAYDRNSHSIQTLIPKEHLATNIC